MDKFDAIVKKCELKWTKDGSGSPELKGPNGNIFSGVGKSRLGCEIDQGTSAQRRQNSETLQSAGVRTIDIENRVFSFDPNSVRQSVSVLWFLGIVEKLRKTLQKYLRSELVKEWRNRTPDMQEVAALRQARQDGFSPETLAVGFDLELGKVLEALK